MSIAAAENAGPSPRELQDPLWVKMSAITGSISKKRKKSDAKPQSQINKCLNEKRRRNQENLFIDELAELISATDMSSGKTDKCQILQRTVDQTQHINTQWFNKQNVTTTFVTSPRIMLQFVPSRSYQPTTKSERNGSESLLNQRKRVASNNGK